MYIIFAIDLTIKLMPKVIISFTWMLIFSHDLSISQVALVFHIILLYVDISMPIPLSWEENPHHLIVSLFLKNRLVMTSVINLLDDLF